MRVVTCVVGAGLGVMSAQSQNNAIPEAAKKTCAVLSGDRKPDGQTLQYLTLLDQDLSDPNPVALALLREVNKQCPKAYLNYQQRKRGSNPFPPGSLVKQTPTQLTTSSSPPASPDYALRCHGAKGMASANGRNLIIEFTKGDHPAGQALAPGQCSWLDRGLNSNEPTRIVDERPTAEKARDTAAHINAGDTWTFWVVNPGTSFKATASAPGTPSQKPGN
jgi:hypothetical protein